MARSVKGIRFLPMVYALLADIGGTNARFALSDGKRITAKKNLKCADFPDLAAAALHYIGGLGGITPTIGAVDVAGPVSGDRFELTNHPWSFSIKETRAALGLDTLSLINDFHAQALGIPFADKASITQLGGGRAVENAPIGVIGPGTGLGVASLVLMDGRYVAVPGEGGHVTMPARTLREFDLFNWLVTSGKYHHVSGERVCSGKGLVNLFDAIRGLDGLEIGPRTPEQITATAIIGDCKACSEALDLMLAFLGRIAGNLALTIGAAGGIYLSGGILPRLGLEVVAASRLRDEFIGKGRFSAYVDRIPTFLVDDGELPFKGLQAYAFGLTQEALARP